jgi:uroporphyrinogen decarboxylase
MTPRERVNAAIYHKKPDRIPRDFAAVPEIWERLQRRLGCSDRLAVLRALGVDCRIVSYDSFCRPPGTAAVDMAASAERSSVGGMFREVQPDGSNRDIWGAHRAKVSNASGSYDEFASHPLAGVADLETVARHRWPDPSWWDWSGLEAAIDTQDPARDHHIRWRVGAVWETAWSLVGFAEFQVLLYDHPEVADDILTRIATVHAANLEAVLTRCGQRIDLVYLFDDLASQQSLLISPKLYDRFIRPHHQRLIDLTHAHGKPFMLHSCGALGRILPTLVAMGLDVLNPIQPAAVGMDPYELKRQYGTRLCFHGGIDVQGLLPNAKPDEVRAQIASLGEAFADGGWILAGSHHIQSDTPVENILAMYGVEDRAATASFSA